MRRSEFLPEERRTLFREHFARGFSAARADWQEALAASTLPDWAPPGTPTGPLTLRTLSGVISDGDAAGHYRDDRATYDWLRRAASVGLSHVTAARGQTLSSLAVVFGFRSRDSFFLGGRQSRPHGRHRKDGGRRQYTLGDLARMGAMVAAARPEEDRPPDQILEHTVKFGPDRCGSELFANFPRRATLEDVFQRAMGGIDPYRRR